MMSVTSDVEGFTGLTYNSFLVFLCVYVLVYFYKSTVSGPQVKGDLGTNTPGDLRQVRKN